MITWGLVSSATLFARGAASFYALRFALGAAEAGFFPGIIFYLTQWFPTRERARAIALFMTATLAAGIVGGPVSGAILSMDGVSGLAGWQWLFLLEGLPAVVLGIVVLGYLTDGPEAARWLGDADRAALVDALEQDRRQIAPTKTGQALKSGRIWRLALAYFTIPVALYAIGFWLPQILKGTSSRSDFKVGLLSAIPYVVGGSAMIVAARHSDRVQERRWHIVVSAVIGGAGFAATAASSAFPWPLVSLSVAMLGLASMFGPFWALATSTTRGTGAAAAIALINSVGNTGGFVGPYLVGYIRDRTHSFAWGLIAVGAILAIIPVVVLPVPEEQPQLSNLEPRTLNREPRTLNREP
jgi:ACS family tartrate transporter-like MFS transporter